MMTTQKPEIVHPITDAELVDAIRPNAEHGSLFCKSIVRWYDSSRSLTERQRSAVIKIVDEDTAAPKQLTMILREMFPGIRGMIDTALKSRDYLRVDLRGLETPLYLTCSNGGNRPGVISVATGPYRSEGSVFLGRIALDGGFDARSNTTPAQRLMIAKVDQDLPKYVGAHGRKTGSCSFCQRDLTAGASTAVGYGPVCAAKYGLPHG